MKGEIHPGTDAPAFRLSAVGPGERGESALFTLADHAGERVVLCFYPREDPPGAQQQLGALREAWTNVSSSGVALVAISSAASDAQQRTIDALGLPFSLLSDEQNVVAGLYGIRLGDGGGGDVEGGSLTQRSTFVVGAHGKVEAVLHEEQPIRHVEALLALLHG